MKWCKDPREEWMNETEFRFAAHESANPIRLLWNCVRDRCRD